MKYGIYFGWDGSLPLVTLGASGGVEEGKDITPPMRCYTVIFEVANLAVLISGLGAPFFLGPVL